MYSIKQAVDVMEALIEQGQDFCDAAWYASSRHGISQKLIEREYDRRCVVTPEQAKKDAEWDAIAAEERYHQRAW
jgi:hypothetical protein